MRQIFSAMGLAILAMGLTACGSSERTVVERPIVIAPAQAAPGVITVPDESHSVETRCKNGYDNSTHSCY